MELNGLYENLYDLGTVLQSDTCFSILDGNFRPWPHVYKDNGRSEKFYKAVDRNLAHDLARLQLDRDREDLEKYTGIMKEVFRCFGCGIIESLV